MFNNNFQTNRTKTITITLFLLLSSDSSIYNWLYYLYWYNITVAIKLYSKSSYRCLDKLRQTFLNTYTFL